MDIAPKSPPVLKNLPGTVFRRPPVGALRQGSPTFLSCHINAAGFFWKDLKIHVHSVEYIQCPCQAWSEVFFRKEARCHKKKWRCLSKSTFSGRTSIMDCAISVLPEPVSPISARLSPAETEKDTLCTSVFWYEQAVPEGFRWNRSMLLSLCCSVVEFDRVSFIIQKYPGLCKPGRG